MATFSDNFSSLTPGTVATNSAPTAITGWEFKAPSGSSAYVSCSVIDLGGGARCLRLADTGWGAQCWSAPSSIGNLGANVETEVLMKWRVGSLGTTTSGYSFCRMPLLRTAADMATGYALGFRNTSTPSKGVQIIRFQGASDWNYIGSEQVVTATFAANDWWWSKVKVDTSGVWYFKFWKDGDSEPSYTTAGTNATNTSGYVGFGGWEIKYQPLDVGYFSVGTNGDPAPSPGGGGNVSVNLSGQAASASIGSISSAMARVLSGQSSSAAHGSVSVSFSRALSGQLVNVSAGSIARGVTLSGQFTTVSAGTITADAQSYIVVIGTPNPTSAYRLTATPDISSGNWVQYRGVGGGAPPTGLVVQTDATWYFTAGNYPANFDFRVSDDGGATWGTWATQSVGVWVSLSGQSASASSGSVSNSRAKTLSGSAASSAPGSVGNSRAKTITGQAASSASGSIGNARSRALTGSSASSAQGSVLAAVAASLSGLGLSIQQGTITTGGNVTVTLAGAAATASAGTVRVSATLNLSGMAATGQAGSLAYASALRLVGSLLSSVQGFITVNGNITVGLTGASMSAAAGSMTRAMQKALSGSAASTAVGSLTVARVAAITGQSLAAAAGTVAAVRALSLLGIPFTIQQGTVGTQQGHNVTVNLTGIVMPLIAGGLLPELTAALSGQPVSIVGGDVGAVTPPVGGSHVPAPSRVGTFASPNPWRFKVFAQSPAGRAGENGCVMGRFAWLTEDGTVTNARLAPTDILAFVLTHSSGHGAVYWSDGRAVLHAGSPVTLMAAGDFWARFEYGAVQGSQVYADKVTGKPRSGYSPGSEATPWWVVTNAAPGALAIISTTSRVQ